MSVDAANESEERMSSKKAPTPNRLPKVTARLAQIATFLCLTAIHFSGLTADELRWKLAPGERYQAEMTLTSKNLSEYETRTSGLSTETRMEFAWQVREVANGVAVIEEKLERIVMEFDAPTPDPAKKVFFDSNEPGSATNFPNEQKTILQSLIGATFVVRMRDDGTIESAECTPETLASVQAAPEKSGVRELLGPEAITKFFEDSTIVFPADEKTAKDGWSVSEASESSWGRLETQWQYDLAGEEQLESKPQLKFIGELKTTIPAPETEKANTQVAEQSTLKQMTGNGVWYFDPAAGFFTSGETTMKIESELMYREEKLKTSFRRTVGFRLRKLD
jgi:hypothetical protein